MLYSIVDDLVAVSIELQLPIYFVFSASKKNIVSRHFKESKKTTEIRYKI